MPSPPCSRTSSHESIIHSNVATNDELDVGNIPNHYYFQATAESSLPEPGSVYDTARHQYSQPGDYFDRNSYAPSNTPIGTPGFSQSTSFTHDSMPSFDMSYMAQLSNLPVPVCQTTWDSRWKSLFDSASKGQSPPSPSPTISQYQQQCRSDSSAFLTPDFDVTPQQSSDTTNTSARSTKLGSNPVSTVLVSLLFDAIRRGRTDRAAGPSRL